MKKKRIFTARNLQTINLLALELSQYRKSGSTFSSSEPVADSSNACRLRVGAPPTRAAQAAVLERCPKRLELRIDLVVKTINCLLE